MFLVNSRLSQFTATTFSSGREVFHLIMAPLIPKLRGYFAEFLQQESLEHLRILSPPTCVGLRYGQPEDSLEGFLGSMIRATLCPNGLAFTSRSNDLLDLPGRSPYALRPQLPTVWLAFHFCVTPSRLCRLPTGAGMFACFPSPTPFGLG